MRAALPLAALLLLASLTLAQAQDSRPYTPPGRVVVYRGGEAAPSAVPIYRGSAAPPAYLTARPEPAPRREIIGAGSQLWLLDRGRLVACRQINTATVGRSIVRCTRPRG